MPITALEPFEKPPIPAIAAKVFPNLWILDLAVRSHGGPGDPEASVYLNLAPYDVKTGEILLTEAREVRVPFWEYVALPGPDGGPNPVAIAMGAVENAVQWLDQTIADRRRAQLVEDGMISPGE